MRQKVSIKKGKTMHQMYGDRSNHLGCEKCGFCKNCGDCKKYGCSSAKAKPKKPQSF